MRKTKDSLRLLIAKGNIRGLIDILGNANILMIVNY